MFSMLKNAFSRPLQRSDLLDPPQSELDGEPVEQRAALPIRRTDPVVAPAACQIDRGWTVN
jgi:hypothetical protein